jgi:hypothetical protein
LSTVDKLIIDNQNTAENSIKEHYRKINEAVAESEKQMLNKYRQLKENQKENTDRYSVT